MLIYLFGLFIVIACTIIPTFFCKKRKIVTIACLVLSSFFMWFLCSFKGLAIGSDTPSYYESYINATSASSIKLSRDYGYGIFQYISNRLHLPWTAFLCICSFPIFFGSALYGYLKTPWTTFMPFFAYTFLLFEFSLSGLRQSIAVGLILIGMALFNKRKMWCWFVYFAFNIFAILMHKSSAVMLVYPILTFIKLTKISISLLSIMLFGFALFTSEIESFLYYALPLVEYYPYTATSHFTLIFIFSLTIGLIVCGLYFPKILNWLNNFFDNISCKIFKRDINVSNEINFSQTLFVESFFGTIPLFIFLIISLYSNTSVRGYYYSAIPFGAWIVSFIWSQKSRLFRVFLTSIILVLFSLYFCLSFLRRSDCVPYEFIF